MRFWQVLSQKKGMEGIEYEGGQENYTDCCSAVMWSDVPTQVFKSH